MIRTAPSTDRRSDALSRDRIIHAAIKILDAQGERALTFRALAARLSTGAGAIYWHIADKDALLAAASDRIVGLALATVRERPDPCDAIRAHALALFDALEAHPWVGTSLSLDPQQAAMIQFLERIGGCLMALGVPVAARFDAWSACVNYILGVAGQNAVHARGQPPEADRDATLRTVAECWKQLDPTTHPFLNEAAVRFPEHDDRAQFLAGINLILTGLEQTRLKEQGP